MKLLLQMQRLTAEANKIFLTNNCYCILGEPARSSRSSEILGSSHRATVSMGAFNLFRFLFTMASFNIIVIAIRIASLLVQTRTFNSTIFVIISIITKNRIIVLTIFVELLRLLPKAFCSKSVVSHFRYWQFSELHAKSWKEYFESQYYLAKYTSF